MFLVRPRLCGGDRRVVGRHANGTHAALQQVFLARWDRAAAELERARSTGALPGAFDTTKALDLIRSNLPDGEKTARIFAIAAAARFDQEARLRGVEEADLVPEMLATAAAFAGRNELDRAGALYELALAHAPQDRMALNNLAGIHFRRKDYTRAAELGLRLLKDDPRDVEVALNVARAFVMAGRLDEAEAVLKPCASSSAPDARVESLVRRIRAMEGERP